MRSISLVIVMPILVGACSEINESPFMNYQPPSFDAGGDGGDDVCVVFAAVFDPYCTSCHSGGNPSGGLDLTPASVASLAGKASNTVGGQTLVVAGDPEASLLYRKVVGPGPGDGPKMPTAGRAVDPAGIEILHAWIISGAAGCETTDEPYEPPPPPPIEPGGDIVWTDTVQGFSGTRPSWTAPGICNSNQWWRYPDDEEESFYMHPGEDCVSCHEDEDDDDAPRFRFAGTVFDDLRAADNCRGVPDVDVYILDGDDHVIVGTRTNKAGNFGIELGVVPNPGEFRVRLDYQGRVREMVGHQATPGACNSCHTVDGANGAPGRVVAP